MTTAKQCSGWTVQNICESVMLHADNFAGATVLLRCEKTTAHLIIIVEDPPESGCEMLRQTHSIRRHLLAELLHDRLQGRHHVIVVNLPITYKESSGYSRPQAWYTSREPFI